MGNHSWRRAILYLVLSHRLLQKCHTDRLRASSWCNDVPILLAIPSVRIDLRTHVHCSHRYCRDSRKHG